VTRPAGFFRELGTLRPGTPQPSIADQARESLPDAEQVVAYLRGGHVLIDMMDVQKDWFDPSHKIMDGPTVVTDGEWYWRIDLAHYVGRHHLRLPADFLARIRDNDYTVPDLDEPTLIAISDEIDPIIFFGPQ
jgi:hypothetical protein